MQMPAAYRECVVAFTALLLTIPATAIHAVCLGDAGGDDRVTVDEVLKLVNGILGSGTSAAPTADDAVADGPIAQNDLIVAVRNALTGCPLTPSSTGPIQATGLVFRDVLPLVGTTLPAVDTAVSMLINQGVDPLLDLLVAADPSTRERIPNGVRLDFGTGTPQPLGTMAGKITATYSDVTTSGSSIAFQGVTTFDNVTVNGAGYPITTLNSTVNATLTEGGKSTLTIALTGTGTDPPATMSGTIVVDTACCPNYPVGSAITTTIGGTTTHLTFNGRCDGTFGFSTAGLRQVNFLVRYFNCVRDDWYSQTLFVVAENRHVGDDATELWDDEPPNLTVSGTLSDSDVDLSWNTKCRTATCDPNRQLYGTFVGRFWKDEEQGGFGSHYLVRHYVGTYTTHFVQYNSDGSVQCEATRVLDEQDGMSEIYHLWVIIPQ